MSDSAFPTAPYPSMTTAELKACVAAYLAGTQSSIWGMTDAKAVIMTDEIARREKVAAGDVSVMTPGERLRWFKATSDVDFAKDGEAYKVADAAARVVIERKWGERAAYFR